MQYAYYTIFEQSVEWSHCWCSFCSYFSFTSLFIGHELNCVITVFASDNKLTSCYLTLSSVLWRRRLGGRKGIWPIKKLTDGVVICLQRGADLHTAQLMPQPLTVSCFSKIQIGFTFLVPAHLGSPGQRAIKRVCVCVTVWLPVTKWISLITFSYCCTWCAFLVLKSDLFQCHYAVRQLTFAFEHGRIRSLCYKWQRPAVSLISQRQTLP